LPKCKSKVSSKKITLYLFKVKQKCYNVDKLNKGELIMNKDQAKLMSIISFLALMLTAAIHLIVFIVGLFDGSINLGWLSFIANIMLTVVVIGVGWQYAKGLSKVWKIIFIVVSVLAILAAVGVTFYPTKN
jgi:cytochrome bd-type quinol oxidase subunit 2